LLLSTHLKASSYHFFLSFEEKFGLSYWLKNYQVKQVQTKKEVKILRKRKEHEFSKEGMLRHTTTGGMPMLRKASMTKWAQENQYLQS